jgi:hypothetical protein
MLLENIKYFTSSYLSTKDIRSLTATLDTEVLQGYPLIILLIIVPRVTRRRGYFSGFSHA